MELSTENQLLTQNHIPVFGVETKVKSKTGAKSKKKAAKAVSEDDLRGQVEQLAYYKAQARGFVAGHELEDWLSAEAEVV